MILFNFYFNLLLYLKKNIIYAYYEISSFMLFVYLFQLISVVFLIGYSVFETTLAYFFKGSAWFC